jgi:hypothetical protein
MANISSSLGHASGQRYIARSRLATAVHDLNGDAAAAVAIGEHHDGSSRVAIKLALNIAPDSADIDFVLVDKHPVVSANCNQQPNIILAHRGCRKGTIDLDTGLLDERGCHQKKDQQDEDHIDQRCHVQLSTLTPILPLRCYIDHFFISRLKL